MWYMYARARAGTGTVTLAALLAAARNAGSSIKDMRFICAGAGSAGLGVCAQVGAHRRKRECGVSGIRPKREPALSAVSGNRL
jgi:malic enzyme